MTTSSRGNNVVQDANFSCATASPNKYLKLIIFAQEQTVSKQNKKTKPSRPKDMLERDNLSSIS